MPAFTNCRGDEDIDAKRSSPSIGKPVFGSCEERTREFVWDRSADHIRASGQTAALKGQIHDRTRKIPRALRAPSMPPPRSELKEVFSYRCQITDPPGASCRMLAICVAKASPPDQIPPREAYPFVGCSRHRARHRARVCNPGSPAPESDK